MSLVISFNSIMRQTVSASVTARAAMESVVHNKSAESSPSQTAHISQSISLEPEKEFILTYEALPELWNTTDLRYTNKMIRTKALEKLLPIYKKVKPYATIEDIRKKINSLRSNYRRELNKVIASEKSGSNEIYYPKAWYFPYLNFLRKLEQSEYQNETLASPINSTAEDEKKFREDFKRERASFLTKIEMKTPTETFKIKKKMPQNVRRERQCLAKPYQRPHQCQNVCNPIALEWADTLERLDPMQRLYAKKAINDILFEAELGNLHKHSVTINESYSYYLPTSSTVQSSSVISPHQPPSPVQTDPISVGHGARDDSSSDVEYKVPVGECDFNN